MFLRSGVASIDFESRIVVVLDWLPLKSSVPSLSNYFTQTRRARLLPFSSVLILKWTQTVSYRICTQHLDSIFVILTTRHVILLMYILLICLKILLTKDFPISLVIFLVLWHVSSWIIQCWIHFFNAVIWFQVPYDDNPTLKKVYFS